MTDVFAPVLDALLEHSEQALDLFWDVDPLGAAGGYTARRIGMRRKDEHRQTLPVIHLGERLGLVLTSSKPGYLTLFNLGASGRVHRLFPRPGIDSASCHIDVGLLDSNRVFGKAPWNVASPLSSEHGFPERIVAILTREPVQLGEDCFGKLTDVATRGAIADVEEAVERIFDLPPSDWCFGLLEAWSEK